VVCIADLVFGSAGLLAGEDGVDAVTKIIFGCGLVRRLPSGCDGLVRRLVASARAKQRLQRPVTGSAAPAAATIVLSPRALSIMPNPNEASAASPDNPPLFSFLGKGISSLIWFRCVGCPLLARGRS
jgi:hypothetical protein